MAVHDHAVVRADMQPDSVAHHMGGELAGKLPAVRKAPQQFRLSAVFRQPHDAQVHVRGVLHVFEIFARAGDQEVFSRKLRLGEARGDHAQDTGSIQVFPDFRFIQHQAYVAAVALVPAVGVHVGDGTDHFHHKGRGQHILHARFTSTFFSYSSTRGNHSPSAGLPHARQ